MENLNILKSKIESLIKLHQQLKYNNRQLTLQNKNLSKTIENQKLKITQLEKNNQPTLPLINTEQQPINNTETKTKIDELVQEIDNCIALLK